ncbi:MAG: hypothetical protein NTY62_00365 [Euryarchaeota archaeon]|nr:hypothetical protein [Euryarchaeota archaeon]
MWSEKRNLPVIVKDEMLVKGVVFYLDSDHPSLVSALSEMGYILPSFAHCGSSQEGPTQH